MDEENTHSQHHPRPELSSDIPSRRRPSDRNAIRQRPPLQPADADQLRRRALSEVVRADLPGGKWRVVSAWSSLRRSLDSSASATTSSASNSDPAPTNPTPSRITSERRDSTLASETRDRSSTSGRKRVSLFLRRRRTASPAPTLNQSQLVLEPGQVYDAEDSEEAEDKRARDLFRRARSGLVPPVSLADEAGGEGGKYLQYAAEVDDDSFERLHDLAKSARKKFVRPGAIRIVKSPAAGAGGSWTEGENADSGDGDVFGEVVDPGREGDDESDEIVGEICLEDFADVGSEDFDFLENQSVDFAGLEPSSFGRRSIGPSLTLDSQKLRWIGNEEEFAAFFAEVGLDEWFDVEGPRELKEFDVDEETLKEWELAAEEHNEHCVRWGTKAVRRVIDIRDFERDFKQVRRRRAQQSGQAATMA